MTHQCVVCEQMFPDIPEDAVEIAGGRGRSRRPMTYAFADGSVHYLRKLPQKKQQPQAPAPELLLEVIETLAALPTPPVPVEIKTQLPLIEPDFEEGLTPMQ